MTSGAAPADGADARPRARDAAPIRQFARTLQVVTAGRSMVEISREVAAWTRASGVRLGLLTLFVRHTSASLLITENADPQVRTDLERFMARLVPDGDPGFEHVAEGPDDMPAHVRAALTQTHLAIPVVDSHLVLGTWQGVYVWEHRHAPHRREVVMHLSGSE